MTAATELGPDQWFPSIMKQLTGLEGVLFLPAYYDGGAINRLLDRTGAPTPVRIKVAAIA